MTLSIGPEPEVVSLPTDPGCLGCRRDASAGFERCFFLLTISHIFSPRLAKCVPGERDRYALPRLPATLQITERRKKWLRKKKHSAETGALAESPSIGLGEHLGPVNRLKSPTDSLDEGKSKVTHKQKG